MILEWDNHEWQAEDKQIAFRASNSYNMYRINCTFDDLLHTSLLKWTGYGTDHKQHVGIYKLILLESLNGETFIVWRKEVEDGA